MPPTRYSKFGGLGKDCRVFLSDGTLIDVGKLAKGDLLLSADGETSEVQDVCRYKSKLVRIDQVGNHSKDIYKSGEKPFGLMNIILSEDQEVWLRTKQRLKSVSKPNKKVIEISELKEKRVKELGIVSLVLTSSFSDTHAADITPIKNYIKKKTMASTDGHIEWCCLLRYIGKLSKEPRQATQILLSPISVEIPVLQPWLNGYFKCAPEKDRIEAMAWLLGFWIGHGSKKGASFTLNTKDEDITEMLRRCAELLDMKLTVKKRDDEGLRAVGSLHTLTGSWNENSPLTSCLKELKFYQNGRVGQPKCIPSFMRSETKEVRETFIAGLIDADGSTYRDNGSVKVKISTVHAPIRDGLLVLGQSLGLSVTVSVDAQQQRETFNQSETWVFHLLSGSNKHVLRSIVNRCSCERQRCPPESSSSRCLPGQQNSENFGLNKKSVPFTLSECGEGEVVAVHLEDPSRTFITEERLICYSAGRGREFRQPKAAVLDQDFLNNDKNFCFSCARAMNSTFEVVPWDDSLSWCDHCRRSYALTKAICLNTKCQKIPTETELKKMKESGVYSCTFCQSEVKADVAQEEAGAETEAEAEAGQRSSRSCLSCHRTTTSSWLKVPWDKGTSKRICRNCSHRYRKIKVRCFDCCRLFNVEEFQELRRKASSSNSAPCPRCKEEIKLA